MGNVPGVLRSELEKERIVFAIHLLALCAFAVAQPVYDLIAQNGDFLTAHHLSPFDIILLALALCLGPPLVLVVLETAVALLLGTGARKGLHWVFLIGLVALIVLPVLHRIAILPASLVVTLALVSGLLVTASYVRFRAVRSFFTLSVVASIVFPVAFLFFSPVSQIVVGSHDGSRYGQGPVQADIPIVFIVFDEFPVTSIMDAEGNIDASAVPHFAALAKSATWYRNASTVSDYTTAALPAILTGTYPSVYRLPHVSNYPGNLFTLLRRSYDMNVIEPFTDLCPGYLLTDNVESGSFVKRFGSLASDISLIYLHHVLPREWTGTLPDVTKTLKNFADGSRAKRSKESRIKYFDRFLRGIRPTPKPSLSFLHIMFPHVPWVYYPSGKRYNDYNKGFAGIFGLEEGEQWKDDEWVVNRAYQRHLLQISFVDKLVGRLLERLKTQKLFDQSLIVITADHGVSFVSGDNRRRLTDENFQDIVGVPLFIKAPFQRKGAIDDRVVESIDILPTIASILGIKVPWRVDGVSLMGSSSKRSKRTVYHYGERVNDSEKHEQSPAVSNRDSRTLKRKVDLFGSNPNLTERYFTFGPHRDLVGKQISQLRVEDRNRQPELVLDNQGFFEEMDRSGNFLFGNISGTLETQNRPQQRTELAIAVNGIIRAVTRTIPARNGIETFSAVVPENSFRSGRNAVDVFAIELQADGQVALLPLKKGRSKAFKITIPAGRITEVLESSQEDRIPVIHGSLVGRLAQVLRGESGDTEFIGWAVDKTHAQPAGELLVFADGRLVRKAATNWHMPAVARFLDGEEFVNSGFWFTLPTKLLKNVEELRLFAVSSSDPKVASELNYFRGYAWDRRPGRFRIAAQKGSGPETVVAPNGSTIPIKPGAVVGQVDKAIDKHGVVALSGWAVEANHQRVPHTILVVADNEVVQAGKPTVFRKDIAKQLNAPQLFLSGFNINVPASIIKGRDRVRVLALTHDGVASEITAAQGSH